MATYGMPPGATPAFYNPYIALTPDDNRAWADAIAVEFQADPAAARSKYLGMVLPTGVWAVQGPLHDLWLEAAGTRPDDDAVYVPPAEPVDLGGLQWGTPPTAPQYGAIAAPPAQTQPRTIPPAPAPAGAPVFGVLPRGDGGLGYEAVGRGGARGGIRREVAPVTVPGPPIVTIAVGIISLIGSLFGGLFGGGVSKSVKRAFEGVRDALSRMADQLMRFIWQVARALGKVIEALRWFKEHVLDKILEHVQHVLDRLRRIYDRILKPYLEWMIKARRAIMQIYETFFRPWIELISAVRAFLAPFRVFGLKWARRLDAQLAHLQEKIYAPIEELLKRVSGHDRWINFLLTAQYIFQRPIWTRSVAKYPRSLVNGFVNSMVDRFDAGLSEPPEAPALEMPHAVRRAYARDAVLNHAGPLYEELQPTIAAARQQLRL